MSVRCTGDCRPLEQVGEKQDFECLLTTPGLKHEAFVLRVRLLSNRKLGRDWSTDYSVTVTRLDTKLRHVYIGGPTHGWVKRFAADLAKGAYDRRSSESGDAPMASRRFRNDASSSRRRLE